MPPSMPVGGEQGAGGEKVATLECWWCFLKREERRGPLWGRREQYRDNEEHAEPGRRACFGRDPMSPIRVCRGGRTTAGQAAQGLRQVLDVAAAERSSKARRRERAEQGAAGLERRKRKRLHTVEQVVKPQNIHTVSRSPVAVTSSAIPGNP